MPAGVALGLHVLRGVAGIAALVAAFMLGDTHPWASIGLLVGAILAFRGCPMCWTAGLVERITARFQGRPARTTCSQGSHASCAVPATSPDR